MGKVLHHPNLKDGVEARAYQLVAAKQAISGSTLLVMPTGLGKTAVQWMAMAEFLDKPGKIVLVAPTTGLVAQQAKMAKQFVNINENKIIVLTGNTKIPQRAKMWKDAKIVIATPHVIRNDARNGRILLSDIDLLIVDEAHHATGSNSVAQLGDMYLEASNSAMVLAATASPGVKPNRVMEVVTRLGIERLHVTKREEDLVQPYVTAMEITKHEIILPQNLLEIIRPLRILEAEEAEFLSRNGFLIKTGRISTAALEEAQRRASAAIGRGDPRGYDAAKRVGDLRRLHRLLDLLDTQGLRCAIKYLDRALLEKDRKTKRFLSRPSVADFMRSHSGTEELHPKPSKVLQLVKDGLQDGGKVIVFTEYRDTVDNLMEIMDQLPEVKAGRFVGQTTKGSQLGMKQKEQIEQLDRFRAGEINVLIATSVGEEGLDVPAADSVILYEPVPSAIRAIQRRGRTARQKDGDVHILVATNTRDEYVQRASVKREQSMYRTLDMLQKQSRLPRREAPKSDVLQRFTVGNSSAEDFISEEERRLHVEKPQPINEAKIDKKRVENVPQVSNRPKSQKSLADFATSNESKHDNWWKPVLDGTTTIRREIENAASVAAKSEVNRIAPQNSKEVLITIDHREANSTLPAMLKLHGHDVSLEHLKIGDVRISDRILIERKTARDLVDSLVDGRLVRQAKKLSSAVEKPLLIIESLETERVHPNAIHGAMAWITLDLGLPVIMTGSPEQTARFISIAAKRESRMLNLVITRNNNLNRDLEKSAIDAAAAEVMAIQSGELSNSKLSEKWNDEVMASRIRILSELPGIGMITAKKIMDAVKDIMGLCTISEYDLAQIDGVSSIQARDLYKFLHG